jgi:predicted extracellular nuclease
MNVHLASKRHQASIFAPENPGIDAKLSVRVEQARIIQKQADIWVESGVDYYLTGDFNDTEHSDTLEVLSATTGANLVMSLAPQNRYDYNHRGLLQVLMHGIVPKTLLAQGRAEYEILHGNELIGVAPGQDSDKPSDHAYVIAKIKMA